jgi:hypothetical protein
MRRQTIAGLVALIVLGGLLLLPAMRTSAASSTVLLATVKVSATVGNQYLELSNDTANPISMTSWQICSSKVCDSFSRELKPSLTVRIGASELKNWTQSGGVAHDADLVCLVDDKGAVVDCINWGAVNTAWPNYAKFKTAGPLINPGLQVPAGSAAQDLLIFRTRTTQVVDNDQLDQWVIRVQPTRSGGGSAAPTATPSTGRPGQQPSTGGSVPQTGAEFPVIVVLVLAAVLLGVRYLRSSRLARH